MSMTAAEAREILQKNLAKRKEEIIATVDAGINQANKDEKFYTTTPSISRTLATEVTAYYENLGYKVINCNNNMYQINFE